MASTKSDRWMVPEAAEQFGFSQGGAVDRLMTTRELARYLSIPVQTLRKWRCEGIGPRAFRVGRHLRYDPAEVQRWLVEECSQPVRRGA